jgi:hypothetical protein
MAARLLDRFTEPSTWAGLASLTEGISHALAGDYSVDTWALIGGGLVAVLLKERGNA